MIYVDSDAAEFSKYRRDIGNLIFISFIYKTYTRSLFHKTFYWLTFILLCFALHYFIYFIDISDDQYPDFGIRSLKMDKKGMLLATGDRNGNLRVHDMTTWEQITYQEAHDSEILSIDISNPSNKSKHT